MMLTHAASTSSTLLHASAQTLTHATSTSTALFHGSAQDKGNYANVWSFQPQYALACGVHLQDALT